MDKYLKSALTQTQAEARAKLFAPTKDNLSYSLFLKIKKGDLYDGFLTIHFDLQQVSSDLFLDYAGTNLTEIVINGQKIDTNDHYESLRAKRLLQLPQGNLKTGKNEVRIKYSNLYSNDGLGLHSFVDTDGKQYIYSQCEPYAANKVLPCFDQPDLKATLSLTMAVPNDWVAVGNEPISEEAKSKINMRDYLTVEEEAQYKVSAFGTTPRLSTYLFVFIAGPYYEVKCTNIHRHITMSCYCRESLYPFLKDQAQEIFDILKETLKFYETYFDYPYPFSKYDTVFCPEFKFGAMEHPGAVTFDDNYIWREQVIVHFNTERANIITHEAAHHWFGDLVTMKWWNDLWLNESFADFICHFCLERIRSKVPTAKISDPWLYFFTRKGWAYKADQQRTTHPIAGEVLNTNQAETIFDGITYSKGAASLKQLMRLIGEENFGKAMGSYFKKFEWANATLNDFIASLEQYYKPVYEGSPSSLAEWKAEWLQISGLNECTPVFNPSDHNKEAKLVIRQTVALPEHPTIRHHKMQIAFFDKDGKVCETKDIMLNNTPETTVVYDGSKQPHAVFLNYQDEAFIKVRLDEHSITFFKEKINLVPDELTRTMIWRSFFDMARDGKLSSYQFIDIVVAALANESSDSTLGNILSYSNLSLQFSPHALNDNVIKPKLFDCILKVLLATDNNNSNRIVLLREYLINFASYGEQKNVDNIAKLIDWFDGKDKDLKGFELDVQNRLNIVYAIHAYPKFSDSQKNYYFNKVADLESSDRVQLAEVRCEAMRADAHLRKRLFASYLQPDFKTSARMLQQSMSGYCSSLRTTEGDAKAFFDNVLQVFEERGNEFAKGFYLSLFPNQEHVDYYYQRVTELLSRAPKNDVLIICLKDSLDDLERKKRGYLCSVPDVMKEFFNISI